MHTSSLCIAYTQNILVIYIVYAVYMSSKFSVYTV